MLAAQSHARNCDYESMLPLRAKGRTGTGNGAPHRHSTNYGNTVSHTSRRPTRKRTRRIRSRSRWTCATYYVEPWVRCSSAHCEPISVEPRAAATANDIDRVQPHEASASDVRSSSESLREHARSIWQAGVDAVAPGRLITHALRVHSQSLHAGTVEIALDEIDSIVVVGAGKAGAAMSRAVEESIGRRIAQQKNLRGW